MAKKPLSDVYDELRKAIKAFPVSPGLYFMKDSKGTVLYIGKAKNLRSRVLSYFQPSADIVSSRGPHIAEMLTKVKTVDFLQTESEVDAVLQEARLIKDIRPPYNSDLTDDKTFPYLEITTRDQFPGVYTTRKPKTNSRLFGPFANAGDLRSAIVILQKIFKFRTCRLEISATDTKRKFFRPCILYSIKQCAAPCADKINRADYRKIINDLANFLNSKRSTVIKNLKKQMAQASTNQDYEKAAMYRDRLRLIENLDKRGSVGKDVQPEVFASDPTQALEKLQKILDSSTPIRVIEGFDIAHIAGAETVGSLVRFIDGRPFKAGYRRYKIKTVKGIDDYACLKEVLLRRYRHAAAGEELWPDLVLIDGGIGQLHAAAEAFKELNVKPPQLASIAKKEEIIYLADRDEPLKLPANNPVRKLFQYIRDEAHRFAQHYHHILRKKKTLGS
ncbi:MAG: excinuclease ABC subunit UvrC [Sedimentisphaerales bacterium]|nr:excinuclease ABC subunit UvrC [Sedimentisphaerales bacterium]